MTSVLAWVVTDATGFNVSWQRGRTGFSPSWTGLQIVVGGQMSVIQAVPSSTQMTLTQPVGPYLTPVPLTPNRETVYQAMFNVVSQLPGVRTASRNPNIFSSYTPDQTPVLWQAQTGEVQMEARHGMPYNWEFKVGFGVYVMSTQGAVSSNGTSSPASLLNPIIDAIEAAINPNQATGQGLTLDGLVYEVRLLGAAPPDAAGAILDKAWALVPAVIRVQ